MLGDIRRSKRLRKVGILACTGVFILCLGMVAGFFISKYVGTEILSRNGRDCYGVLDDGGQPSTTASGVSGLPQQFQRGMPLNVSGMRQLPQPGTQAALDMQNSPDAPWASMVMYTYASDADIITEALTEAFLDQLKEEFAGDQAMRIDANFTEVVDMLEGVARDILSYFRYHRSEALLPMLRQFSMSNAISMADINPDVLQHELHEIMNITTMGHWYAKASTYDVPSVRSQPPPAVTRPSQGQQASLLQGNGTSGRHLLGPVQHAAGQEHLQQQQHSRHLHEVSSLLSQNGPLMTLEDMLCAVSKYSPTGLQGISLPPDMADGINGTTGPLACKPPNPPMYKEADHVFHPVVIPVVFHCQRYMEGDILQPPIWDPEGSAQHLIDVTNRLFKDIRVQFKVKEIRHDVEKHPYLLLASLADWQSCTGTPSQEAAGFPCLKDTANFPDVSKLAEDHVINVLVGGSQTDMFCNNTPSEPCTNMYLGYTAAMGPWHARPSPTWREGLSEENWVFITWDMLAPSVKNAFRFWDGGGITLAHELGHHLGLMHTHEGSVPCEGDGPAKADSVPDTPVNLQTVQWAAENGLAVQLAKWCAEFRNGKKPDTKVLLPFNSCKQDKSIDNVFNVLSYLPDPCCMMFSPNQQLRMQWAMTRFRPKMMAKYAA